MSYRVSDEQNTMDTVGLHILNQKEFVFHIDEEPDVCRDIKIGDILFKNDTYICIALSSVDQDGYVRVMVDFVGVDG